MTGMKYGNFIQDLPYIIPTKLNSLQSFKFINYIYLNIHFCKLKNVLVQTKSYLSWAGRLVLII